MNRLNRLSGILLHPTSLPSPYGIGDLGKSAYEFVDFLQEAGQHLWQILPLTHTGFGDSPYQGFSAFAGQPLLISPDHLKELELIMDEELHDCPETKPQQVDYGRIIPWKHSIFHLAYTRFLSIDKNSGLYQNYCTFCEAQAFWLNDYALFLACKDIHDGRSWLEWEEKYLNPAPEFKNELHQNLSKETGYYKFLQFLFFAEWKKLKSYANERGIQIIGDIPIFVSMDSADVWANKHLFQLDSKGYPLAVAGVPPDYFSSTGQLWGNPLYDWEAHRQENFHWWITRIKSQLENIDILRIDHFRGFESYWSVPYGEETAIHGEWIKAPGIELFTAMQNILGENLPIIAEDLGVITAEVEALRDHFHFPGMKVLQFAFDSLEEGNFLPHRFTTPNCVCYTGTHDNDTTLGWFHTLSEECQKKVMNYTCTQKPEDLSLGLLRACLGSIAAYAIFPLQDLLALGSDARMNFPGIAAGNWNFRYQKESLTLELAAYLKELTILYGRFYA